MRHENEDTVTAVRHYDMKFNLLPRRRQCDVGEKATVSFVCEDLWLVCSEKLKFTLNFKFCEKSLLDILSHANHAREA